MTQFTCMKCRRDEGDVRLVEHGIDDHPLCKSCYDDIMAEFDNRIKH